MREKLVLAVLLLLSMVPGTRGHEYHPSKARLAEIEAKQSHFPPEYRRDLQSNATEHCSLCSGFPIREDLVPSPENLWTTDNLPVNWSCQDYDVFMKAIPQNYSFLSYCLFFRNVFSGPCCTRPAPPYVCEQTVRSQILSNYDASVMPLPSSGLLDVLMTVEFHHITELSTKHGTVTMLVWLFLTWKDPRLSWPVGGENCTTSFLARASNDMERTEIWAPDIDLFNQVSGVQQLPEAMATVFHDGTVTWKRGGELKANCFFTGLDRFPFDTLGCTFLFGTWTRLYNVHITLGGPNSDGWKDGETLQRVAYNEYTLMMDQTTTGYRSLPLTSVVYYNLYFERSSRHYVLKVLLPTVAFTILSFGVFFLDLRVGERLTYGLTVLLVIIAQDISTSTLLPITNEQLWINMFVVGSFYWVLIANLESVFVAWLYFIGIEYDEKKARLVEEERERRASLMSCIAVGETERRDSIVSGGESSVPSCRSSDEEGNSSVKRDSVASSHQVSSVSHADLKSVAIDNDVNENGRRRDSLVKDNAPPKRVALFSSITARKQFSSGGFKSLRQLMLQRNLSSVKRHETIKKLDMWFFWVLSTTYTLFVILMFLTNSLWDDPYQMYEEGDSPSPWAV